MEASVVQNKEVVDEEEYILLDLDDVCGQAGIPANAPYVLSGLDTLNPMLVIGDHIKLLLALLTVFHKTRQAARTAELSQQSSSNALLKSLPFFSIGEYQETVGTCYVFSESDVANVVVQSESGPSETNLIRDTCIIDPNQPSKGVKPIASLHKVLKFRLATEDESQEGS